MPSPPDQAQPLPHPEAPLGRLPLLARRLVEGFITGLHNSPFHGFGVGPQALRQRYQDEARAFRLRRSCSDSGIEYAPVSARALFDRLLLRYLVRRARV